MKQKLLGIDGTGAKTLVTDRALKPAFGIEIPVSSIISKLSAGLSSSKSSTSSAKSQ